MRSKSARWLSSRSAKATGLAAGITLLAAAPMTRAWALTVTPLNFGGSPSPDSILYYASYYGTTVPTNYVLDTTDPLFPFGFFGLSASQAVDNGSLANAINFQVTSTVNPTLTSGQAPYLIVTTTNVLGSSAVSPVAIGGAGGTSCVSAACVPGFNGNTYADNVGQDFNYYFAVPFTPSQGPYEISLYPKDMCTTYAKLNTSALAQGCVVDPTDSSHQTGALQAVTGLPAGATSGSTMVLTFQVVVLTNAVLPSPLPAAVDSAQVSLRFEDNGRQNVSGGAINCPATPINYQPGDTQIVNLDTSAFANANQGAPSGYAPITMTILAGQGNATSFTTSSFIFGSGSAPPAPPSPTASPLPTTPSQPAGFRPP